MIKLYLSSLIILNSKCFGSRNSKSVNVVIYTFSRRLSVIVSHSRPYGAKWSAVLCASRRRYVVSVDFCWLLRFNISPFFNSSYITFCGSFRWVMWALELQSICSSRAISTAFSSLIHACRLIVFLYQFTEFFNSFLFCFF